MDPTVKTRTEAATLCSLTADQICKHISSNKVARTYNIAFTLPHSHKVSRARLEEELKRVLREARWGFTRAGVYEAPTPLHDYEVPKFRFDIAISWPDEMNDKVSAEIANSWK
ncbi:hypothetical protein HDU88_004867 [Geranomyces variabilis]|nr:hypothetical protein HDU88_004867 [Geranomyces variabilis]